MFKNRLFIFSFFSSLLFHATCLLLVPFHLSKALAQEKIAEVVYEPETKLKDLTRPQNTPWPLFEKNRLPLAVNKTKDAFSKKIVPSGALERKDALDDDKKISYAEKPLSKEGETNVKRVINLPNVPGEIARSPAYKSYYQIIRDRIKKLAYRNYKKLYEGEVFMTFVIDSSGELLAVELKKEKSTPSEYLATIALESVEGSAPYPPFPEKLKNNKKLTFNVIISFEIK
jgi:outer membrane biosynthesis protein TonB